MTMARAEGVTPPHQAQKLCVSQNERQTAEISIPATLRGSIRGTGRAQRARLGVSFRITGRKSYGYVGSLEEAKAAFRAEYLAFKRPSRRKSLRKFAKCHVFRSLISPGG
jgi:hypothetical protein